VAERTDPSAGPELGFSVEIDADKDLAFAAKRADALVTVRALADSRVAGEAPFAEILIMDRSQSMASGGKIGEAKRAAYKAIDAMRDGALLGIIAGNWNSELLYPATGRLARVDANVRKAAKRQVHDLLPYGGTRIGRWLTGAEKLFAATESGTVCHAALYTDGHNEHETPEELGQALEACADRFVCDVRGLGDDWNYAELLRIAEALHGDARAVVDVADLAEDFTRLIEQARRLVVPRAYLGLHLNDRFKIGFVRQTRPVEADLTAQAQQQRDGRDVHIPLGSWAPGTRHYHVSLTVDPNALPIGQEVRAARVTVLAEAADGTREPRSGTAPVIVRRLATTDAPVPRSPGITLIERVHELSMAIRALVNSALREDFDEADLELREAIQLARDLGDTERLRLLEGLGVVGQDGALRLNRDVRRGQLNHLGIESSRTGAIEEGLVDDVGPRSAPVPQPVSRVCPSCGQTTTGMNVKICENCRHRFDDEAAVPWED